jgi:predicted nucleic acid-binding protein
MLIDSNIVIYSALPENAFLDMWLDHPDTCFSIITRIEVLGFAQLPSPHLERFIGLFDAAVTLGLDNVIAAVCIDLRRSQRIKLGDAIIAATALVHHLPLLTRNVEDFRGIPDIQIVNPFL